MGSISIKCPPHSALPVLRGLLGFPRCLAIVETELGALVDFIPLAPRVYTGDCVPAFDEFPFLIDHIILSKDWQDQFDNVPENHLVTLGNIVSSGLFLHPGSASEFNGHVTGGVLALLGLVALMSSHGRSPLRTHPIDLSNVVVRAFVEKISTVLVRIALSRGEAGNDSRLLLDKVPVELGPLCRIGTTTGALDRSFGILVVLIIRRRV